MNRLVFTTGVGEHSVGFPAAVCDELECLGLRLDSPRNRECSADADIADKDSSGRILILRKREELMIAREVWKVV